jgi:four helix bundle protein
MGGVKDFEDLIAWQKARILTKNIYEATQKERFGRDFGLASQIQRASVSIMANIAEGFTRKNPNEYYRFVSIAKSSASEVRSHLYVGLDIRYITETEFKQLIELTKEVERLTGGLLASIDRQRNNPT